MRLSVKISVPNVITQGSGVELLNLYPGAAAAYSLRLLNTNYTGSAIRVRRADDNEESDIGFRAGAGGKILDTTTLEAFSLGGDCFVTIWYDQSGNGKNVSRANASEQPQIVENGSAITQNGNLTIRFNGFGILNLNSFNSLNNQMATTGVYVAKGVATSSNGPLSLVGDGGGADDFGMTTEISIRTGGGYRLWYNTTPTTQLSVVSLFKPSGANIVDVECSLNGSILTATGISDNLIDYGSNTNLFIGSKNNNKFDGVISEAILYPTNELDNREGIEANINDYYSLY